MSNFFKNSDLDNIKAESIVSDTLNNCDDGELYLRKFEIRINLIRR